MKVISFTAYGRPDYLAQMLASLKEADGIGDYLVIARLDPSPDPETRDRVMALAVSIDFAESRVVANPARLGPRANTEAAIADALGVSDYAIFLEEDNLLARDALRFFEFGGEAFRDDPKVFSVTGYNRRPNPAPPEEYHRIGRRRWYHPWSVATWRDRHAAFLASGPGAGEFDVVRNDYVIERGLVEVYPLLSRSQNIGMLSSVQTLPPSWFEENHRLKFWAGNHDASHGVWAEVIEGRP